MPCGLTTTPRLHPIRLSRPRPLSFASTHANPPSGDEFMGSIFDVIYQGNATSYLQNLIKPDAMVGSRLGVHECQRNKQTECVQTNTDNYLIGRWATDTKGAVPLVPSLAWHAGNLAAGRCTASWAARPWLLARYRRPAPAVT